MFFLVFYINFNFKKRYLGLETMCKYCQTTENVDKIENHLPIILKSLKVNDVSIKRRALDLLYIMCSQETSDKIVKELLSYAEDWADA